MDNICIGTAQLGMDYGVANKTGQPGKPEIRKVVKAALDNGLCFFDTAASYGQSESILGEIFSDLKMNQQVNVITKLPPIFVFEGIDSLRQALAQSLERLCVETLWGVMLHRTGMELNQEFSRALAQLKNEGILRHFGVSIYSPEDALAYAGHETVDMIQVPFNIMDRRLLDNKFFEVAQSKNKAVFIRSIFLQGLLLMDESAIREKKMDWTIPFLREFHSYMKNRNLDAKAFMIHAISRKFPWAKLVIGMENHDQLMENITLMQENNIPDSCFEGWWAGLPAVPERLVNPALW
ncbi:MAG: aldo/keto reductase [Desulfobacteraceae bacterium]|nr:aldo/keto reductase [Desulfobacteraceae bacterium]MBU4001132.1 aldo/keto reductase [Pseudomonadota bacterium]